VRPPSRPGSAKHRRLWNHISTLRLQAGVEIERRYESGVPLDVEPEKLEGLKFAPGAELVNFDRGRVKPRTTLNFSAGVDVVKTEKVVCSAHLDILNLADRFFAYNFGNPFEGTHFGYGRRWSGGLRFEFR
jgi:hypothetical protein